jgi:DNA-binding transcriptional ArsR family regulator
MPDTQQVLADAEQQIQSQLHQLEEAIASREQEIATLRRQQRRLQTVLNSIRGEPGSPQTGRARPGANRDAILNSLREHGGLTASEIAEHTGIARPTVTAALARLSQEGLVRKERSGRTVRHDIVG